MNYTRTAPEEGPTECKAFWDVCRPLVYRQNSFRITGLQVNALTRAIKRRIEDLKHAEELGNAEEEHRHAFALNPVPGIELIQGAAQRLQDPESRMTEEFFWFWPQKWSDGQDDRALSAISNGDRKTAADCWTEALSNKDAGIRVAATHNLAVMFQLMALDGENALLGDDSTEDRNKISRYWRKCFAYWEEIGDDEVFWSLVSERIRLYDDPRLTTGFARRLRTTMPSAMAKINGMLALGYAERGDMKTTESHIAYMRGFFKGRNDFSRTVLSITEPLRTRVKNAVENAIALVREIPANGAALARELLDTIEKPLRILRAILPTDEHERIDLCDSAADALLTCQDAFGRDTKAWSECVEILEAAQAIAESEETKGRVADNLSSARIAFLMDPIWGVCEKALKNAEDEPESADRQGRELLMIVPEMLARFDSESLSQLEYLYRANDRVAFTLMQCAIAFGNKTERWQTVIPLLEAGLEIANDPELKERIEQNLQIARKNVKFSELEQISSAPFLGRINGIGFGLYGNSDYDPETGSHVATYCFSVLWVPIIPICRYRVIPTGRGYRFLGKVRSDTVTKFSLNKLSFNKPNTIALLVLISGLILFILAFNNSENLNRDESSSFSSATSAGTATSQPQSDNSSPSSTQVYSPPSEPAVNAPSYGTRYQDKALLGQEIESDKRNFRSLVSKIRNIDSALAYLDEHLKEYSATRMIHEYNDLVPKYNSLIAQRKKLYRKYKKFRDNINSKIDRYNSLN